MSKITFAQTAAFGRHVVSYAMGAVTALAALHVIDAADAGRAGGAITQIGTAAAQIAAGVATLVSVASGLYAAWTASPLSQLIAVARNPAVRQVAATPMLAAAAAHGKVVAR